MGLRREGREAAVQFLFAHDLQSGKLSDEEQQAFWDIHSAKRGARGAIRPCPPNAVVLTSPLFANNSLVPIARLLYGRLPVICQAL